MRQFIDIITESALSPTIVEDDGDVPHAMWATFDDEAHIRYWATNYGYIVIQTMHSSPDVRGRDMLRWLNAEYDRPIEVVEATHSAMGFWEQMEREGLVDRVDGADGNAHYSEKKTIPIDADPNDYDDDEDDSEYIPIDDVIYNSSLDKDIAHELLKKVDYAKFIKDGWGDETWAIDASREEEFAELVVHETLDRMNPDRPNA